MHSAGKPRWQQMTALVSLSAGGVVTGFSFVPAPAADLASPTGMPIRLMALAQSARLAPAGDAALRSAIVNVANYYLRMAAGRTPAEIEAMIWQHDSIDGVDHGESCAAFASLTLELAAQVVGQQSWVTGGTSYPWPLHKWADVRVDPNPASLGIISVRQDAEAHHRWHPLGDRYEPLPGDWVLFNGHVEVVTKYAGGVLRTVGGDSLPNLSVNAHAIPDPLAAQGVVGFVNNGDLSGTAHKTARPDMQHIAGSSGRPIAAGHVAGGHRGREQGAQGLAEVPGTAAAGSPQRVPARPRTRDSGRPAHQASPRQTANAAVPGAGLQVAAAVAAPKSATRGGAAIPGLSVAAHQLAAPTKAPSAPYRRHHPSTALTPAHDGDARQAFISAVAPGAVAAQRRYGVPASVTIAQAIDESGWGQSKLATNDHNLFGIKGTGPAGSDSQLTQEYDNGLPVTRTASFRVYHTFGESIDDHGRLLATSEYYRQSMADRQHPDAFAATLTGVYATDPDYGAKLISLMRQYDLYRYDVAAPGSHGGAPAPHGAAPGSHGAAPAPHGAAPGSHGGAPAPDAVAPVTETRAATPGAAAIPGLPRAAGSPVMTRSPVPAGRARSAGRQSAACRRPSKATPSTQAVSAERLRAPVTDMPRQPATHKARGARGVTGRYQQRIPLSVQNAFISTARMPLIRAEPLYRDIASHSGIPWELLAACDWMQCEAQPRYSPVHGEKLGTANPDGTVYRTKSAALERCADDLAELAEAVYRIDLTAQPDLSVRDLANVFAAFRWGGLLKLHRTSAMEFPYSVQGLTARHLSMRWPNIAELNAPDKPGSRFRMPFGAVPLVLGLNYPATV